MIHADTEKNPKTKKLQIYAISPVERNRLLKSLISVMSEMFNISASYCCATQNRFLSSLKFQFQIQTKIIDEILTVPMNITSF